MYKHIVFAICGCLFFINGFSQSSSIEKILEEIEQNNTELKGYQSYINSQQLENKSTNNLPDPQFSGFYLPFGKKTTGDYTEFQISQSFEYPTVYAARDKWNLSKTEQLESAFAKSRQELLLKAKNILIELAFFQKQRAIESERRTQGKRVFDQIQELFDSQQVGILDLNKAKIAWMQEQFIVEQIDSDIRIEMSKLKTLNGGISIESISSQIILPTEIGTMENLWNDKLTSDPRFEELQANETASLLKIKLEKSKTLPNMAFGLNYQGVRGSNYTGFYGGISIPLWNSKYKVEAAEANHNYQQSNTVIITSSLRAEFQENYIRYELMLEKYNEYKTVMGDLNSESLLFEAYKLGEYSFMEYYLELQFYRNASDKMLQMQKELHIEQAQLLKHQL